MRRVLDRHVAGESREGKGRTVQMDWGWFYAVLHTGFTL